ncbi:Peptidase M16C associated domain protein [Alkaliphilus metalliredigens QYMF]|uniref:Peptidase M16C associated domain protein n=1 Tax=Alkaliphilus metalliredigens (strain QYMF) TaxID=293826 RepID=A6TNV9_ALKMQ|nr:insulinase family protein [Alkaliphilus metalliredigens]ABR47877.1 Peptidase M16C associated domain protein [Alkaliphilus metalliredigens QYMF]
MSLEIGKQYHGFKLLEEKEIKEVKGMGRLFQHEKSGARLFYIQNQDNNKVFSITFRTPPKDSTGLPHILEHSVLCGSRKFPLKDPFIELAKGSMNTFLNAMTFSDKTMYPIASKNEKDFVNLMDVYLDAVFHPNIYQQPEILMQEGWHYELENTEAEIEYKGVVYNEMKGAFSSPEQMLFRKIQESLFPDTTYGYESGGDPEVIPDLTQEQFLGFHKKYYHPSNSYIYLYGDGDLLAHLKFINEGYLKDFNQIKVCSEIEIQQTFKSPKVSEVAYPISANEKEENKTFLSLNFTIGKSTDPELYLAFDMLNHLLLGTPAAPLKKALLESDLGKDVFGSFDSSILQPVWSVVVKNTNVEEQERFQVLVFDTLKKLVKEGIDKRLIEGVINLHELKLREADYGRYPKGLIYCIKCMDSWLYGEDPSLHLAYEVNLEKVKKALDSHYFEALIEKHILQNTHRSLLIVKPEIGLANEWDTKTKQELADYKVSLSDEEIADLVAQTQHLRDYQETPNSEEDINSIPLLSLEDIEKEIEEISLEEKSEEDTHVLFHPSFTNGIAYTNLLFDTTAVAQEEIPYIALLSYMIGKVSTEKYSYEELSKETNIATGGISTKLETYSSDKNRNEYYPKLIVRAMSLVEKLPKLFELLTEMISASQFDDNRRLKEVIRETKSRMEMSLMQEGHMIAAKRSVSQISTVGKYIELTRGVSFYQFVSDLETNFDEKLPEIQQKLKNIAGKIFVKQNLLVSVTTEEKDYPLFSTEFKSFVKVLKNEELQKHEYHFDLEVKKEALLTSSKVQYVAKSYNFKDLGYEYSGHLQVLKTIISLDYLWNRVRIAGGAYGAMAGFMRNGNMYFVSYRDPNLRDTLKVYDEISEFLKDYQTDQREMTKYIIGTISNMDAPLSEAMKADKATHYYISGITKDDLQKERNEVLSTTLEDINILRNLVEETMKQDNYCILGNEEKLKKNADQFDELINVFE